ncbi:acetyltransferase-like isoleucine patch superfamily enzyme [Paenibacillus jamilae]|nr:CatB-related O-acetyltransferase [Paenibacillus polymyxa]MDP9677296.1 acetyltransferase-like isoleucine patch superfamily enzyme [Paenibacillus jamilae]
MNWKQIKNGIVFTNQNPIYANFEIGDWTYGNPSIYCHTISESLKIGKFCSIADNVTIMLGGEHRVDWLTTYPFSDIFTEAQYKLGHPATKGNVTIGDDVWIGNNVMILSGVTIGVGAVIGAGSIVTKDVPPYSIVGGNPARIIRYRFKPEEIEQLVKIAWWEWPIYKIKANWDLLLNDDISVFIERHTT